MASKGVWSGASEALVIPLFSGAIVRSIPVLRADFPLNDGGLFYAMTQDLQRAHERLPAFTTYNGGHIPFAYPPLGFYIADLVTRLGPWSLLAVFHILPLVVSILTIPAFFLLARVVLHQRGTTAIAVAAFALIPHSFEWEVGGGGLTRGLGLLFVLLALWQGYQLFALQRRQCLPLTALCAALAVLSHPEAVTGLVISFSAMLLCYGRSRLGLRDAVVVIVGAAVLTVPWWGTVVRQHGFSPLLSASRTGGFPQYSLGRLLFFQFTDESLPIVALLGLIGALLLLIQRHWFLPAWFLSLVILDPRGSGITYGLIPLTLLAALASMQLLVPHFGARFGERAPSDASFSGHMSPGLRVLGGVLLFYTLIGTIVVSGGNPLFWPVPRVSRGAMQWVAQNTPAGSRFLVVSGQLSSSADATAEWFPALTRRVSVNTVQGQEWLVGSGFNSLDNRLQSVQRCVRVSVACIEEWADADRVRFTHVYLAKVLQLPRTPPDDAALGLRDELRASRDYALIYDGPGASIFVRRTDESASYAGQ